MDNNLSNRNTRSRSTRNTENRNLETRTVTRNRTAVAEPKKDTRRSVRTPVKKKKRVDLVPVLFLLMFIYLGVHIIYFATKEKHPLYEVPRAEAIHENIVLNGLIIREEVSFYAQQKGYINYYIASGRRAAAGTTIYTIDQDGEFSKMILSSTSNEQAISKVELEKIIKRIKNLQQDFSRMEFQEVYDTKSAISAVVMDALTATAIEKLNDTMGITGFTKVKTDRSGMVSFTSDCYDGLKEEELTLQCLRGKEYSKIVSTAGEEKNLDEFVYKMITNEAFQIYFEMDEADIREYGLDKETKNTVSVIVYLNKIDEEVTAKMQLVTMSDGKTAAKLSIPKYGSNYVSDRYIEFELVKDHIEGIKIPKTSVIEKNYFMIPIDFVPTGETYEGNGVLKLSETGEGVFVKFDSYKIDREAGWYYVWSESLSIGDVLLKVDSLDTYQIITTEVVTGVYEANQGYTEFKIVTILQETEDKKYYIIKPKVSFGIAPFDYIVIEAKRVTEGQVLE